MAESKRLIKCTPIPPMADLGIPATQEQLEQFYKHNWDNIKTDRDMLLIEFAKNELKYDQWLSANELAEYILQRKTIIDKLKALP
jgi:hypothetical protein